MSEPYFLKDACKVTINNLRWEEGMRDLAAFSADQLGASPDKVNAKYSRLELQEAVRLHSIEYDTALGAFTILIVKFPAS